MIDDQTANWILVIIIGGIFLSGTAFGVILLKTLESITYHLKQISITLERIDLHR